MNLGHGQKIVLLGMMSKMPVAGVVWQTVHYLVGFKRLGYEVYYVEAHARTPSMFMERADEDASAKAAAFIAGVLQRFDLGDRWAFHALHDDGRCYGLSEGQLKQLYRSAALLINMHGGTEPLPEHSATDRLIYLETDPVALQIELYHNLPETIDFLAPHCAFFTFGENYGNPDCKLPVSDRFSFRPTRQPVVLDFWAGGEIPPTPLYQRGAKGESYQRKAEEDSPPSQSEAPSLPPSQSKTSSSSYLQSEAPSPPPLQRGVRGDLGESECPAFTTIGNWRQPWREVQFQGEVYHWSKHHEFLKFLDLPRRTEQPFELALSSYSEADRQLLESKGWRVRHALNFSTDLDAYRDYILRSRGEFTVAKDQNVRLRSGWFSDRSATYLAAGRPVITQETGFSYILPTGQGLFAFSTLEEVLQAVETINSDYRRHSAAAYELAREYFSYDVVLPRLLADVI